ncbi:Molybdopterin synthase catalytic subunit [Dirofilaria immitis]
MQSYRTRETCAMHSLQARRFNVAGKRVRCPQTQKFCCWLTPTRDSHTGQPDREVQWSSLTMEVPPS